MTLNCDHESTSKRLLPVGLLVADLNPVSSCVAPVANGISGVGLEVLSHVGRCDG